MGLTIITSKNEYKNKKYPLKMINKKYEEQKLLIEYLNISDKKSKNCNSRLKIYKNKNIILLRCTWSKCGIRYSPFSNTILENMKFEPFNLILILKLWLDGITTKYLHKCMNISRYTLYKLLRKVAKI
ncbi:hypothetical protein H312_00882, partial [Anncaliia algerae PRA339]